MGTGSSVPAGGAIAVACPVPTGIRDIEIRVRQGSTLGIILNDSDEITEVSGVAGSCGKIFVGDRILSVNGMMHVADRGMLDTAGPLVRLRLCNSCAAAVGRPVAWAAPAAPESAGEPTQVRHVTIERLRGKFGFDLQKDGVTIERVLPGFRAAQCGQLFAGDLVLSINRHTTTSLEDSARLLKDAGSRLVLEVASPIRPLGTPQPAQRVRTIIPRGEPVITAEVLAN